MATSTVQWNGYTAFVARLEAIANLDPTELIEDWTDVIVEDNRAGVLAGLDKDGNPMVPVKYRTGIVARTRFRKRTNPLFGRTRGSHKGSDGHANGNLTTEEYKQLTGPPLAPRGEQSRAIANLHKLPPYQDGNRWIAECTWNDVVSVKGVPFLKAHFDGKGRLPKRDLRGVRPVGMEKCRKMLRAFVKSILDD